MWSTPGDNNITRCPYHCSECQRVAAYFKGKTWKGHTLEELRAPAYVRTDVVHAGSLPVFPARVHAGFLRHLRKGRRHSGLHSFSISNIRPGSSRPLSRCAP